jgi:hypothetical protein
MLLSVTERLLVTYKSYALQVWRENFDIKAKGEIVGGYP